MQNVPANTSTKSNLKILLLPHHFHPSIGGIEVISELLATAFTEAGHDVQIVTWSTDTNDKDFPFSVLHNPTKPTLLREYHRTDVVFENNSYLHLAWPILLFNRPVFTALHTWIAKADGSIAIPDKIKTKRWPQCSKRVVAISYALRRRSWPRAIVINNPYRASEFCQKPTISKSKDFLFLGRLVSDKGVQHAIEAIHHLNSQSSNAKFLTTKSQLTIVGEGSEREILTQLVRELQLEKQVLFTGSLRGEDLVDCLNQHRFLLALSLWEEPFGVVALETMACNCIPLVSDGGDLPEAVGNAGLAFKQSDVTALINCIHSVLDNHSLQLAATPAHLAIYYSDTVVRQYLSVFEECVL